MNIILRALTLIKSMTTTVSSTLIFFFFKKKRGGGTDWCSFKLKIYRDVSTDYSIKKSLAIVGTSATKKNIKHRIIFEDDKEMYKKNKNTDIGSNMDVDEKDWIVQETSKRQL